MQTRKLKLRKSHDLPRVPQQVSCGVKVQPQDHLTQSTSMEVPRKIVMFY